MLDDVGRHLGNRDPDLHADRSRHRIVERPKCFERSVELIKGLRTDDYLKLHLRPALRHGHRRPNRFGSSARHILQTTAAREMGESFDRGPRRARWPSQ